MREEAEAEINPERAMHWAAVQLSDAIAACRWGVPQ